MVLNIRGSLCCSGPKLLWLSGILLLSISGAYGQEGHISLQPTNEKTKQIANIEPFHPLDIPVGKGDLVHIDVFDVPELSRDVRVSDTGDISYPLIPGKIPVAGLSPFQLEAKFEQLLAENGLVSHPEVSVFVKEQTSQPVSVVGAVNKTMVYQVVRPTTLLEVLTAAGGVSADAGSLVIVTRPVRPSLTKTELASTTSAIESDEQKFTIRLQDLLDSGDSVYNIQILGGDTVTVPRAGVIYVLGFGATQPGQYILQSHGDQVTVLKALALAHGMTTFARGDSAVIMRTNPDTGQKYEIPVRLKEIQNSKAEDVSMRSDDILYIPDSAGKKALAKGAEAALQIGTGVAIYRAY